jgi:hypothetical protein
LRKTLVHPAPKVKNNTKLLSLKVSNKKKKKCTDTKLKTNHAIDLLKCSVCEQEMLGETVHGEGME